MKTAAPLLASSVLFLALGCSTEPQPGITGQDRMEQDGFLLSLERGSALATVTIRVTGAENNHPETHLLTGVRGHVHMRTADSGNLHMRSFQIMFDEVPLGGSPELDALGLRLAGVRGADGVADSTQWTHDAEDCSATGAAETFIHWGMGDHSMDVPLGRKALRVTTTHDVYDVDLDLHSITAAVELPGIFYRSAYLELSDLEIHANGGNITSQRMHVEE